MIAASLFFQVYGQQITSSFIDSIAKRHSSCNTVLLFSKIRDTTDGRTGQVYTQRISIYYDRVHKQLRDIAVYNFDKKLDAHIVQKAVRRQKQLPFSSHIVYTYYDCNLIKVKIRLPEATCKDCSGEYYYTQDTLFSKKETSIDKSERNFVSEANFYLAKLDAFDMALVQCKH